MASSLAAELKETLGVEAELIAGRGGIFDVHLGDQLVYSKAAEGGQFPATGVIPERIRAVTD